MQKDDLVIVPYGRKFFLAKVTGPAYHNEAKVTCDAAFRRPVEWLNDKKSIPRDLAKAALQSRMKAQQTCAYADDLIDQVMDILRLCAKGKQPTFQEDLHRRLVTEALGEIKSGRINERGFERMIQGLLLSLGADKARIVPRKLDKGADIIATFIIANTFSFVLAVQAKHFQATPPVSPEVIIKLVDGMEAESADLGWVVTSGTFSEEAVGLAKKLHDEQGARIELVDGEQLASLIIEVGFRGIGEPSQDA